MSSNDIYGGPSGVAGSNTPRRPTKTTRRVGSYRMPTVLPSGALLGAPGGATTIGVRGNQVISGWEVDEAKRRRQNERDRRDALAKWQAENNARLNSPAARLSRAVQERDSRAPITGPSSRDMGVIPQPQTRLSVPVNTTGPRGAGGRAGVQKSANASTNDLLARLRTAQSSYFNVGTSGNITPRIGGADTHRPRAGGASSQSVQDRRRREEEGFKTELDGWVSRFPQQTEQINQIMAIESLPETTIEERNIKQDLFQRVRAKGEVAEWANFLSTGFWGDPSKRTADDPLFSQERMYGIDTMQQRDRFAKSYAFIDDATQFGLSEQDVASMMASGILTYGKTNDKGYRVPIASVNRAAFERFLDDNYTTDAKGKYERKGNNLVITDDFKRLANGSVVDYDQSILNKAARVLGDPRSAANAMVDIPRLADGTADYNSMATQYLSDEANYSGAREKIIARIRKSGGGELLDRIYTGNFDQSDVEALKKYMYSFDSGRYATPQKRWIAEELLGIKPQDWADDAIRRRGAERYQTLVEANEKERVKAREEEAKLAEGTAEANFRYVDEATGYTVNARPVEEWPRILAALIDQGAGGTVPRDVLNTIFFSDVQTATRKDLSDEDKRMLYVAALEAYNAGAPVDPFILSMVAPFGEDIPEADVAEEMFNREGDQRSWFQRSVSTSIGGAALLGASTLGILPAAVLGTGIASKLEGEPFIEGVKKYDPGRIGREVTVGKIPRLLGDPKGPLSPEEQVDGTAYFGGGFWKNLLKSPIRASLALPMGIYMAVTAPVDTTKAILQDYGQRYGALWGDPDSNFIESSRLDPLAPLLDLAALVPVIGLAAKGAQAARIASVTTRINKPTATGSTLRMGPTGEGSIFFGAPGEFRSSTRPRFTDPDGGYSLDAALDMGPTYGPVRAAGVAALANGPDKPTRYVSAWKFARAQRAALTGDALAHARLAELAPEGYGGLNSAYTPHLMDYVAAWFTPRYTTFSLADVRPKDTPEGVTALEQSLLRSAAARGIAPEQIGEVIDGRFVEVGGKPLRRRAGSPLARGFQDMTFVIQKGLAKKKPNSAVVNMPLLGFNFRYINALKQSPYGANELMRRSMMEQMLFQAQVRGAQFNDAEQLTIMSEASGGMLSKSVLLGQALLRLERLRDPDALDSNLDALRLTEERVNLLEDPAFERLRVQAVKEMHNIGEDGLPVTLKGKQMRAAADRIRHDIDKMRHEAGIEVDALSARELELRYLPFFNAARLSPETLIAELADAKVVDRVAVLNGGWHFLETGKFSDIPDGQGNNLRSTMLALENADDVLYKDIIEQIRGSVDYMGGDTYFRGLDNTPLFVVDRVETIAGRQFVYGRRLNPEGSFTKSDEATRRTNSIIDPRELVLPAEVFYKRPKSKGKAARSEKGLRLGDDEAIVTLSRADGSNEPRGIDPNLSELHEHLLRASLNFAQKLFPDARDFTDKVTFRGMADEVETFKQKTNENIIASSGLAEFKLDIHFAAMTNATYRRFQKDLETEINNAAIFVTREQLERYPEAYEALRTVKVHDTYEAAEKYMEIQKAGRDNVTGIGIEERVVNGKKVYVTKMSYIDTVAYALREQRTQSLVPSETWMAEVFAPLDEIDFNNANSLVMVVPRGFKNSMQESYNRSRGLAHKAFRGYTTIFKLLALSMNPRFVTQQFFGTMVLMTIMNPMQAGHIMAKFFEYSLNKQYRQRLTGKWKEGIEVNPFANHGMDYDIILNRFVRDFEDQEYGVDAAALLNNNLPGAKFAKVRKAAATGYIVGMGIEKNFRVAVIRQAALEYPGFRDFMNNNPDVAKRALEGIPEMGYSSVTKFHAAMDMMSDPTNTKYFDPLFMRELRHSADMVSGNYRDFNYTERLVRDIAVPFYAWQRHSALFTKRLVQERPLTANNLYNLGNYGYEKIVEAGGLPDWLLESVPMPELVAKALRLDPEKENRLGFGMINPFGTFGRTFETVAGYTVGGEFKSGSGFLDLSNPLLQTFIEQSTGTRLLTGAPTDPNQSLQDALWLNFNTLPPIKIISGLFKTSRELNELRGMKDPSDILKDPFDPNSRLNIPKPKFSTKFPTLHPAGLVSSSIIPLYSLDADALGKAVSKEYKERGVLYEEFKLADQRAQLKTANALRAWAYKRDFVFNVWMPQFGASNPDLVARVLLQLDRERPKLPKGFNPQAADAILSGRLK